MDGTGNAKDNRAIAYAEGDPTRAVANQLLPSKDESDSPLNAGWDAAWLAEIDTHIETAADSTVDLRRRLGSVGAAAELADEIFESRLPKLVSSQAPSSQPPPSQPDAPSERQRRLRLTQAVGTRMDRAGQILHGSILPALAQKESIGVVDLDSLSESQRRWLRGRFLQQVFPLLTPLAVDSGRPFPHLESGSLTILTVLHSREADLRYDNPVFALVQVPDVLERWLLIDGGGQETQAARWFDAQTYAPGTYVWSESVVRTHVGLLFPGMNVSGAYLFRILRPDQALAFGGGRRPPSRGDSLPLVRLDVEESMPLAVRQWLARHLVVPDQALVRSHPPMAMATLTQVADRLALRKRGIRGWLQSAVDLFFGHI